MKKNRFIIFALIGVLAMTFASCNHGDKTSTVDDVAAVQTEQMMLESAKKAGMPGVINFTEKQNLKWIYELCDQADFICYAYYFNAMTGDIGAFIGETAGYGIPYSTQYSNPERLQADQWANGGGYGFGMPQPEPNGLFKPEGLSATWLIVFHPETQEPKPMYVEPQIIVSPWPLQQGNKSPVRKFDNKTAYNETLQSNKDIETVFNDEATIAIANRPQANTVN